LYFSLKKIQIKEEKSFTNGPSRVAMMSSSMTRTPLTLFELLNIVSIKSYCISLFVYCSQCSSM